MIKCFDISVPALLGLFLHIIKNKLLKLKERKTKGHVLFTHRLLGRVVVRSTPVDDRISKFSVVIKVRVSTKGSSSWVSSHGQLPHSISINEAVPMETISHTLMISISKEGLERIFLVS